jgi:DNA-binding ferritin-like protein
MVTRLAPILVVAIGRAAPAGLREAAKLASVTRTATHVLHTATAMVALLVATALHTATVTHALLTATDQPMETAMAVLLVEIVRHTVTVTHVLHTATAMAQPAEVQLAAPHLAR